MTLRTENIVAVHDWQASSPDRASGCETHSGSFFAIDASYDFTGPIVWPSESQQQREWDHRFRARCSPDHTRQPVGIRFHPARAGACLFRMSHFRRVTAAAHEGITQPPDVMRTKIGTAATSEQAITLVENLVAFDTLSAAHDIFRTGEYER